jgi:hypothetical protein
VTLDGVGQSGTVQEIVLLQNHLSGKWLEALRGADNGRRWMTLRDGLANDFDSSSPGGAEDNQFHRVSAAASSRGEVHSRTSTVTP